MRKTFPVAFLFCDKLGLTNLKLDIQIQDFLKNLKYTSESLQVHKSVDHVLYRILNTGLGNQTLKLAISALRTLYLH